MKLTECNKGLIVRFNKMGHQQLVGHITGLRVLPYEKEVSVVVKFAGVKKKQNCDPAVLEKDF